jgi:hypothetical protein
MGMVERECKCPLQMMSEFKTFFHPIRLFSLSLACMSLCRPIHRKFTHEKTTSSKMKMWFFFAVSIYELPFFNGSS